MSLIKINTLTMVHIGSGYMLQNDSEYVEHTSDKNLYLSIIDPNKMLGFIKERNINDWIESIEKGIATTELVNKHSENTDPSQYSKREIYCYARNIKPDDTLKECIHNGMGLPYIPGSSIKGAIRTAILASLTKGLDNTVLSLKIKDSKGGINSSRIETELLGGNPRSDVFRFLQVGDAYFRKGSEIATRMVNLNITKEDAPLLDRSKPQLIEAIRADENAEFQIKLSPKYYEFAKARWSDTTELRTLPDELRSIDSLLNTINTHTKVLLQDEINIWENISERFTGAEDYIDKLKELLKKTDACKPGKECVLRIGHGSGWRFITGAWTEDFPNFKDEIIPASRPHNEKYQQYDFPKSRRIDENSNLLGFVKLTLE